MSGHGATDGSQEHRELARIYDYRLRGADQAVRQAVWAEIARWLLPRMGNPARLLDAGGGRCELINAATAAERWVVDMRGDVARHAAAGVRTIVGDVREADLPEAHFDGVVASNVLEHQPTPAAASAFLTSLHRSVAPGGCIAVLGPNFKYAQREYFDVADHTLALTHVSAAEHLHGAGFTVEAVIPRFLPYSFRGQLPLSPQLVRTYLAAPPLWRVFGKQFLLLGRRR